MRKEISKPPSNTELEQACQTNWGELTAIKTQLLRQKSRVESINASVDFDLFVSESNLLSGMYGEACHIQSLVGSADLLYRNAKADGSIKSRGFRELALDFNKIARALANYSIETQGERVIVNSNGQKLCYLPTWQEWCKEATLNGAGRGEEVVLASFLYGAVFGLFAGSWSGSFALGLVVMVMTILATYFVMKNDARDSKKARQDKILASFPFENDT